jgi:triacylglycerol lipase
MASCGNNATASRQNHQDLDNVPLVLAHGLSGWRKVSGVDYFFRVPQHLKSLGYRVYVTEVPPWAGVARRAEHLARQIDLITQRSLSNRVHIIAHSMGGLDARYAISRLGMASKVSSLTTVATPHRGTPLADGYDRINAPATHPIQDFSADFWIWTLGGFKEHSDTAAAVHSLAVDDASHFNTTVPNVPAVRYYSFAGRTLGHPGRGICDDGIWPNPPTVDWAPLELIGPAMMLSGDPQGAPIANDGLVTVESAKWGIFMGCLPADHVQLIGHPLLVMSVPPHWDHLDFYARWAEELTSGQARQYPEAR